MDYELAKLLAAEVVTAEPFEEITDAACQRALSVMEKCRQIIVTEVPIGTCNQRIADLINYAKQSGKAVTWPKC